MIAALSRLGRSKITEIRKGGSHWIQPFSCRETVLLGISFPVLLLEPRLLKILHPKEKKRGRDKRVLPAESYYREHNRAALPLLPAHPCHACTVLLSPRSFSCPFLRRGPQFGFLHPAEGEAHQVSPDSLKTC